MNFQEQVEYHVGLSERSYIPVTSIIEDYIPDAKEIQDNIVGSGRWDIQHEAVYEHEGRFWMVDYNEPATEDQDYELSEHSVYEVFPESKIITVFVRKL